MKKEFANQKIKIMGILHGIKQQSYDNEACYTVTEETSDNRDQQYTELKVKPDEWTKTDALT